MTEQAAREAAAYAEWTVTLPHDLSPEDIDSMFVWDAAWAACEARYALTEAQRDLLLLGLDRVLRWGEQLSSGPPSPTHVPQMVKQLRDILESMPSLEAVRAAREGQDGE
jgi:hypothetical protein